MDPTQEQYDALRKRLREHADKFPLALQRLGEALWNEPEPEAAHAECLSQLPAYIDAELAGEPVAQLFPAVKHHLDRCDTCGLEYAELLESEWAEQRGTLTASEPLPYPDLSFLPPLRSPMETTVLEYARNILAKLEPARLVNLDAAANAFFPSMASGMLRETQALYGASSESLPLPTLAATYETTRTLAVEITRTQFDAWLEQSTLEQNITPHARAAANAAGMDDDAANAFALAYAESIAQAPALLRDQLSK